ncbi:VOC family protein [Anaeromicrobium sediminis]|uniref:Fosfomycin resistance protein FosB n=1 Tax=Anaeromicrobium sediminis TaxID=1478221 RepID=A0A267MCT7_9FIRM|nr:VOC family protein [Anaeromicrobium sediminis]PAB56738.1 fosfomycin resistance protein FosB [Anaeromicrobium sediminis]
MDIKGINHMMFSVSDLQKSIRFYQKVFGAKLLVEGKNLAYFDLNGLWIALNVEKDICKNKKSDPSSHMSFSIDESDYDKFIDKLQSLEIDFIKGRVDHTGNWESIYFRDPDGYIFEFHTKSREERIKTYKSNRDDLRFYA